ncbi:hypothetical protein BDZ88DRAFT_328098 [Geranomyces variabilis]|nr:hypothetical protein BDZ88DRAFT_328098 [Geranomyces variabilis]KAJ3139848.1 hypothetical protein HDU90_008746 [Geranomyces variabilis]
MATAPHSVQPAAGSAAQQQQSQPNQPQNVTKGHHHHRRRSAVAVKKPPTPRTLVRKFVQMLVVDVVLPVAVYYILKTYISGVYALLIGSVPALLSVIVKWFFHRTVDIVGLLVFVAFAISAIVAATIHSTRALVFEKSLVTVVLGVLFFVTLIPMKFTWRGERMHTSPMIFLILKQFLPLGDVEVLDAAASDASDSDTDSDTCTQTDADEPAEGATVPSNAEQKTAAGSASHSLGPSQPLATPPAVSHSKQQVYPESSLDEIETPAGSSESLAPKDVINSKIAIAPGETVRMSKWDFLYRTSRRLRYDMRVLTVFWGAVLIVEMIGRVIMVISPLSDDNVVLYANVWFAVILILGIIVTVIYAIFMRRRIRKSIASREQAGEIKVCSKPAADDLEAGLPVEDEEERTAASAADALTEIQVGEQPSALTSSAAEAPAETAPPSVQMTSANQKKS